jgi:preprotein translocase subunit SecA
MKILKKIFGDRHAKAAKKIQPIVDEINTIYDTLHDLSDDELRNKTIEFKSFVANAMKDFDPFAGLEKDDPEREKKSKKAELAELNNVLDDILPDAFAVVKEGCKRLTERKHTFTAAEIELEWNMIPYDVQLIGGIMLHQGKIAEMATGEGKTLVATLPLYLNALADRGVHLVTVNDYLARRDAEWMGQLYEFLGFGENDEEGNVIRPAVGVILSQLSPDERRKQYSADITYGTNNEFGFDYLRDNMAVDMEYIVQRSHHYCIVDEVDSVLVDEARTPLIIAGPVPRSSEGDFNVWNGGIKRLVGRQRDQVVKLLSKAEMLLKDVENEPDKEKEYEVGKLMYKANRAAPKHKKVLKLLSEHGVKRLRQGVEDDYIREKRVHELDDDLYYVIDEKAHSIDMTDLGREELSKIENKDNDFFTLPDLADYFVELDRDDSLSEEEKNKKRSDAEIAMAEKSGVIHTINQLLRAHSLFLKDDEYVIENGKIQIVDEFTGRIMYGRRYSDGLHQAIEAKEGVKVEAETQTIATITIQNYFRLYGKLAGMTGTAVTEEDEFFKIYNMEVAVIPTNRPITRLDDNDEIYRTSREKYAAIINEIIRNHELGLPILVGTTSVEVSELIARMLGTRTVNGMKLKDRIHILNAKQHQSEAEIVAQAGRPGAIMIATNMAGRGTDIKIAPEVQNAHGEDGIITRRLASDPGLKERHIEEHGIDPNDQPGGLQIIGTERHEARRIDRQLRGRSGRQGDPGRSLFYMSLEDDLMRLFGGDRMGRIMDTLGLKDGEVIAHPMVNKAIEKAQKRVEQHNFSIREHLLKYDDVMNLQREVVYSRRRTALKGDIHNEIKNLLEEYIISTLDKYAPENVPSYNWDWAELRDSLLRTLMIDVHLTSEEKDNTSSEMLEKIINEAAAKMLNRRREELGDELYEKLLRFSVLRLVDQQWMEHLYEMDRLKEGIGLRSYAQKDPLIEYKREGLSAFEEMLGRIAELSMRTIMHAQVRINGEPQRPQALQAKEIKSDSTGMGLSAGPGKSKEAVGNAMRRPQQRNEATAGKKQPIKREEPKVGRNETCPCGSGKKFKHCHGR